MNVAHIVPALFGPHGIVGGAERYALELARQMADRVPTTLITFGEEARTEQIGVLRVRTIGGPWLVRGQRTNPFSLDVFREIRGTDVVHCHQHHVLVSSAVAAWCRMTGKRVFVSDLGGGGWDVSAYVSTDTWFHGHLHLSEYSRRIHGHAGFARAYVVGGGVDTEKFSPDASVDRDGGALFVGRLLPHKGISDLIRGLPDGVPLTVVGPVPDPATRDRLVALAHGKRVTFLHGLDDRALVREYRRALCIVLPSVYRTDEGYETCVPELLGQTLLEGMACGAPAICTDVASMPEVVEHGVTGFVVPPNDPASIGDRLAWLRAHADEAVSMGLAARQRVLAHFTWANTVDRCLDAYRSASSRRAVRSAVSMNNSNARGKASA
jgi:glycosyltransferase involved in cell wall biosynthesis